MLGDKLVITPYHRQAAALIFPRLRELAQASSRPVTVSVAGESGCGKSETAAVLAEMCEEAGYPALILQQDDYFHYPPHTNAARREEDIEWVGTREVDLDTLDRNLALIREGRAQTLEKPLVIFDEDRVTREEVDISGVRVAVAEGTYTTLLRNLDLRAFIDRDYRQTKKARLTRSRDPATEFLEQVLAREHALIAPHREQADIVIPPPPEEAAERE